jgi:hypothetical protein
MSHKNLLALPLVGALALSLIASVSTYACSFLVLRGPDACRPAAEAAPCPAPRGPDACRPAAEAAPRGPDACRPAAKAAPRGLDACRPAAKAAPCPAHVAPQAPEPEQPKFHTLTIYNGDQAQQQAFVGVKGSWQSLGHFDVFLRDGPTLPWRYYGTYPSPRQAEAAACSLRANGTLASVRLHCD